MHRHSHGGLEHNHGNDAHQHEHDDEHPDVGASPELDLAVPDSELSPQQLGRRGFLQRAGLIGSIIGAIIVLLIWIRVGGRRSVTR